MELLSLLSSIPQNEHGVEKSLGRDTLASTGVLWAECDKMVALGSAGVAKVAAERVEEYYGLLKDAITELEEWDPDETSESDTDSLPSNKGNTSSPRPIDAPLERSAQDLSLCVALFELRLTAALTGYLSNFSNSMEEPFEVLSKGCEYFSLVPKRFSQYGVYMISL